MTDTGEFLIPAPWDRVELTLTSGEVLDLLVHEVIGERWWAENNEGYRVQVEGKSVLLLSQPSHASAEKHKEIEHNGTTNS